MQRRNRQTSRRIRRKPKVDAGPRHRFRQQEEVGGTAARERRHHIERFLGCDPDDLAHRLHDLCGQARGRRRRPAAGAKSPVTPAPTRAGLLGMARITGTPAPHQPCRAWILTPAATESTTGRRRCSGPRERREHGASVLRLHREDDEVGLADRRPHCPRSPRCRAPGRAPRAPPHGARRRLICSGRMPWRSRPPMSARPMLPAPQDSRCSQSRLMRGL